MIIWDSFELVQVFTVYPNLALSLNHWLYGVAKMHKIFPYPVKLSEHIVNNLIKRSLSTGMT